MLRRICLVMEKGTKPAPMISLVVMRIKGNWCIYITVPLVMFTWAYAKLPWIIGKCEHEILL